MRKTMMMGLATLMTAAALATAPLPAQAGGKNHHGNHHGHKWHHGRQIWGFDHWDDGRYGYRQIWWRHIRWCERHYRNYDSSTNSYYRYGRWLTCDSPYI
jgi:hypothetical protein